MLRSNWEVAQRIPEPRVGLSQISFNAPELNAEPSLVTMGYLIFIHGVCLSKSC